MKIGKDRVVELNFCLKNKAGEVLEESEPGSPMSYVHGNGTLLASLEKYLSGKRAGDVVQAHVSARDGFGERDEKKIFEVDKKELGGEITPQVGMNLQIQGSDGATMPATITKVKVNTIILDANHPFAGMDLSFSAEVLTVRKATKSELDACCDGCETCES